MTTPEIECHRIWITMDYFVTVDRRGYVLGTCFEGALGCVIPLCSADGTFSFALKIPRAMADTIRENAFICQIVELEAGMVRVANERAGVNSGLLPAELGLRDVLRGTRQFANGYGHEADAQHGGRIFVSFSKDRNPRFCCVCIDDGAPVVFPPGAAEDLAFVNDTTWKAIADACRSELGGFRSPYFFELPEALAEAVDASVQHGRLVTTIQSELRQNVWYTALPSILYRWATGTLQEAVSQQRHRDWRLEQHYSLIHRLLLGVHTLHARGLIHGDLRPANIMACGNAGTPEDYTVGDYGSFSAAKTNVGEVSEETVHTMIGPGVGRHRMSVFYAPERRAGVERESADVAVILRGFDGDADGGEYFVHLGWRSRVIDPRTHAVYPKVLETLRSDWQRMRERQPQTRSAGDQFFPGDRLRLREFIFTVLDAEEVDDPPTDADAWKRVNFRCDRRFAKVLHERIAIYNVGDEIPDVTVISVPNYVEIHQWSAATDLYGVGALALYTIFTCGLYALRHDAMAADPAADPDAAEIDLEANPETMLSEMIETLESVQYFQYLWNDLEDFRRTLEDPAYQRLGSRELAALPLPRPNQGTLLDLAKRTVNNLIRGVPHLRVLLDSFRAAHEAPGAHYNAAHFLLFMHFVMACLHRRDQLQRGLEARGEALFCANRCDPPRPDGPATAALGRLRSLRDRFKRSDYDTFTIEDKEFVDYDPRSDLQIRIELSLRNTEIADLKRNIQERNAEIADLKRHTLELGRHHQELRQLREDDARQITRVRQQLGDAMAQRDENARLVESLRGDLRASEHQRSAARVQLEECAARRDAFEAAAIETASELQQTRSELECVEVEALKLLDDPIAHTKQLRGQFALRGNQLEGIYQQLVRLRTNVESGRKRRTALQSRTNFSRRPPPRMH